MKSRLVFQVCPDLSINIFSEHQHDDGHVTVDYHWFLGKFDEFTLEFPSAEDFLEGDYVV